MTPLFLAIDPGKTTGMALWVPGDLPVPVSAEYGVEDAIKHTLAVLTCNERAAHRHYRPEVVIEDFVISERTIKSSRQTEPLDILGWVKIECRRRNIPLTLQSAAQAKSFATAAKLKKLGWYHPTKGGHANDALRHLLVYLVNNRREYGNICLEQLV